MMKMNMRSAVLVALLSVAGGVSAGELFDLYQLAVKNDARYAVAKARQESAQQIVPIARSGLLPRVSLNGSYGRNLTDNESLNFLGSAQERRYQFNPENYSAVLVQPLYNQGRLENYWQSEWQVKQADAQLDRSLDDLKARITQAFLLVNLSASRLVLIDQQKKTYAEIRQQSQRAYEAGYGTITEIAESESRLDELLSEEVLAKAAYANRLTELRNIIGNAKYTPVLINIPSFVPDLHTNRELADWLALADAMAPALKEQAARVKTSEYEVSKARSGFLPTVDLRLQYAHDKDASYTNINNTNTSKSVVVSMNLPLFEGGETLAQTRRAAAELSAAQETARGVKDELAVTVEKEYGNVTARAVRIVALEKAVKTNELLVKATQKSVSAGVRTNIDVLNAQNQLFEARMKLTQSRVDYLQSLVNLRSAVGEIKDEELLKVDAVLHSDQ